MKKQRTQGSIAIRGSVYDQLQTFAIAHGRAVAEVTRAAIGPESSWPAALADIRARAGQ